MLHGFSCENGVLSRIGDAGGVADLRQAVWIDLEAPSPAEMARVREVTGLAVPSEADINEIESSSRLATHHGALYLSLPLVGLQNGAHTVAVGFVLSPERLLTVRFSPSAVFTHYADAQHREETGAEGSAQIFVGLLEAIVDRQADALEQVRSELGEMSQRIFALGLTRDGGRKQEDRTLRETLGALGRSGDLISHIRETQVGAARIVPYVETAAAAWLPKALGTRLRTLRRDIASVSDFATHLNDKLQFLLDATLGFISIAQNNVMKVMTVASVAGIPPVLVAGIYGMNFKAMPELGWSWGYPFGLALIVVTAVIPLVVFRIRGWI